MTPPSGYTISTSEGKPRLEAWSPELPELFANAARALFVFIAGERLFKTLASSEDPRRLEIGGRSTVELLTEWLNILNATHKIHRELYTGFEVSVSDVRVSAAVHGAPIDPERDTPLVAVKNVTWKGVTLIETGGGHHARIGLDV